MNDLTIASLEGFACFERDEDLEDRGGLGMGKSGIFLARLSQAVVDVGAERGRQDEKWGEQNHDPFTWLTVLGEEYGEACQAALHAQFGGDKADGYRNELVQIAAVAVAAIECYDRKKGAQNQP